MTGCDDAEAEALPDHPLSNIERLRAHLAPDSLAVRLLETWANATPAASHAALLDAVDAYFAPKQEDDGAAAPQD